MLLFAVLFCSVSFPSFSAGKTHEVLTHLDGNNLIKTNLDSKPFSNPDRLFDGDSSATHSETNRSDPDGNGIYSSTWYGAGQTRYLVIDLGESYELSQINTYFGWAPQTNPNANTWEYNPPSAYKIYVSDTEEGLINAEPLAEVTGLVENDKGVTDSFVEVDTVCRYVKIEAVCRAGRFAIREIEFVGALSPRISLLGASIRLENNGISAGLRFGATIDKSLIDFDSSSAEFGMYLLPSSMLKAGETLSEYLKDGEKDSLKIAARKILEQDDSTITYTAVLTNIPESAYNLEIAALPYAVVDGKTIYFDEIRRSYAGVAHTVVENYSQEIGDDWCEALLPIAEGYQKPIGYYDVDAAAKELGLDYINAVLPASVFVDIGSEYLGYKIDGSYKVDRDSIYKLFETPCIGDGKIAWIGFNDCGSWSSCKEQPEYAPVEFLNDPIYMSMILPSERTCYLSNRTNGSFLDIATDDWVNVMTIGAIYKNTEVELPDDAEFTVCISDVNLALRTTKSDGWFEAINIKVPTMYNHTFPLPWNLESSTGTYKLTPNRVKYFDDHVEIKLYGRDLNATDAKLLSDKIEQCVYHYWGSKYYFDCKGSEVLGMVCSYKVWIKEPEASEYLVASIGADWRSDTGTVLQAFAGKKYAVTTTPATIIGHNVPLSRYRDIMDSEKVQEILGIE